MNLGLNLRLADLDAIEAAPPPVDFWEVIAENLFDRPDLVARLQDLDTPISLHAVGMNLAGIEPLERAYVDRIGALAHDLAAVRVSDHLCWQHHQGVHGHDLFPFPRTAASQRRVQERVDGVQQRLGRQLLVENLSTYVEFAASDRSEAAFLSELVARTGCGLLLDLCNLAVNEANQGTDADAALNQLPLDAVEEVHVAGPSWDDGWCIDTHSAEPDARQRRWVLDYFADRPICYERDQERGRLAERWAVLAAWRHAHAG